MFAQIIAARVARNIPPVAKIAVDHTDWGARLAVAIITHDGRRHGVKVLIERDDLTVAADRAAEHLASWMQG